MLGLKACSSMSDTLIFYYVINTSDHVETLSYGSHIVCVEQQSIELLGTEETQDLLTGSGKSVS